MTSPYMRLTRAFIGYEINNISVLSFETASYIQEHIFVFVSLKRFTFVHKGSGSLLLDYFSLVLILQGQRPTCPWTRGLGEHFEINKLRFKMQKGNPDSRASFSVSLNRHDALLFNLYSILEL